jgi:hypothetical protein
MAARFDVPEVFIDGEKVVFEGNLPATLGGLQEMFERALADAGRVLAGLSVDGRSIGGQTPQTPFPAGGRIDVLSITVAEARMRMVVEATATLIEARRVIDALAGDVLRVPWSEAVGSCVSAAETVGRVLQDATSAAGNAGADNAVTRVTEELARVLGRWMDAVQARDAAAVCLCCDAIVLPVLVRLEVSLATMLGGGSAR